MDIIVNKTKDQCMDVLQETKLDRIFEFRMTENDVVFRSIQRMNEHVPSQILFKMDKSIYNDCMVTFGTVEKKRTRGKILELMNELNLSNRICKYSISKEDDLVLTSSCISEEDKSGAKLFLTIATQLYKDFSENIYKRFEELL